MFINKRDKIKQVVILLILVLGASFAFLPVYVIFTTIFKSFDEVNIRDMWNLPESFSLNGVIKAFVKLSPNLFNSFVLTIPATLISALLGSLNGYVLSKWRFRGSEIIFVLMLFGMFIPYQSILIPLVQFLSRLRLYGSLGGLVIVHIIYGLPITTLIFRNYYTDIPDAMLESAHLDGVGILKTYGYIVLPVSLPAFAVVIIWQFTSIWNEFLFAVTLTQNPATQPVTVALQNLAGSQIVEWNVQMAGAVITALPTLLVYILLGKFFIRGLLSGSVK